MQTNPYWYLQTHISENVSSPRQAYAHWYYKAWTLDTCGSLVHPVLPPMFKSFLCSQLTLTYTQLHINRIQQEKIRFQHNHQIKRAQPSSMPTWHNWPPHPDRDAAGLSPSAARPAAQHHAVPRPLAASAAGLPGSWCGCPTPAAELRFPCKSGFWGGRVTTAAVAHVDASSDLFFSLIAFILRYSPFVRILLLCRRF